MRNIRIITNGIPTSVGPLIINQPLPVGELRYADPFVLLHHAGPQRIEPGSEVHKVESHPHRGFEPVSFVFSGTVIHRDSLGNVGKISGGEVQWITSGKGILHEEGPSLDGSSTGVDLELIQLWINLPSEKKMMEPAYQELHKTAIPDLLLCNGKLRLAVVAGDMKGIVGPAVTQTPISAAMGWFEEGANGMIDFIHDDCMLLYVLAGTLEINDEHVASAHQLVVFDNKADEVSIRAREAGRLLLLSGQPLNEPIATYGPFVMNSEEEIREAFRDYAGGKFGTLE
ncbi:MAG: pirin family protein [Ignavibacteria bacterium]|nr:pirin family protein [Ignavibacteria bacterium]